MNIGGLEKCSLIDYPDKVCCIVYTVGCQLRCKFCYNIDLLSEENFERSSRQEISECDVLEYVEKNSHMLDAVTITGGEPTLQRDLPIFCHKIKQLGKLVKIDTNGYGANQLLRCIKMGVVDYIAMDLKGPPSKYKEITGVDFSEEVSDSINIIKNSGVRSEFRATLYPELTIDDVIETISLVKGEIIYLQKFEPANALFPDARKMVATTNEFVDEIVKKAGNIATVRVRGF